MDGKEIRDFRKSLKKSQTKFGKELDVSRDTIAKYEGDIMQPGDDVRKKLEQMMGKSPLPTGIAQQRMQNMVVTNLALTEMFQSLNSDDRLKAFEMIKSLYLQAHRGRLAIVPE